MTSVDGDGNAPAVLLTKAFHYLGYLYASIKSINIISNAVSYCNQPLEDPKSTFKPFVDSEEL